jgi:hypothetical protein
MIEIQNIHRNIMGTISLEIKTLKWKKFQEFIVYPISSTASTVQIPIQSDNRWGYIRLDDLKISFSQRRNNANSWSYAYDESLGKIEDNWLTKEQAELIRNSINATGGIVGNKRGPVRLICDNSGATSI